MLHLARINIHLQWRQRVIEDGFDDFPLDRRSCRLLGPTALIVQALMGVLVILSLVYKRHREPQKRPWRIWLFDVSKQIVGQMFVHGMNVLISNLGSHHSSGNACTYYFLNVLIDTTLGVALIYLFLHAASFILTTKLHLKGFRSGQYGTPPSIGFWSRQAAIYVMALTTMKLLVVALFAAWPDISKVGDWLLSWTSIGKGDAFQVIFVMGLFPIIMNILQFWLIDSIVKASAGSDTLPTSSPRHSDAQDREPLFQSNDDDDDASPLARDIESQNHPSCSRAQSGDDLKTAVGSEDSKSVISGVTTPLTFSDRSNALTAHDYPPGSAGSSLSHASSSSSSLSSRHKYKRSPPPPLQFHLPLAPAINSPDPSHASLRPSQSQYSSVVSAPTIGSDSDQDSSWDGDDWAERVGEEEWTGRRQEQKKGALSQAWNSPAVQRVGSS
ncbi:vacuolar membrane protein-domain-containing protein [Hygrophoropsis aurantiaca]|uniref:Vacuolar membrane protein-domain-containing protein n=1 Tax=Hygrophoropsis aurantiaca TaxID=72124 RepID=A0ACB8A9G7_9AGAM|nr:vacuolar membrane protein-domain-containing protein [Hygrophoropsis aurantiaca]